MTSPSKIRADRLINSDQIEASKFNYDRYSDMESEITKENIIEFLKHRVIVEKKVLEDRVR